MTKQRPIAWKCSDCETVFALDRVDAILTKKSTEQINKDFEMHCKGQHPGSQIIGLDIPHEDFSQATARIVKRSYRGQVMLVGHSKVAFPLWSLAS